MSSDEIRDWLRDNLMIEQDHNNDWGGGNSVLISLRFQGEPKPFSFVNVYIPRGDDE